MHKTAGDFDYEAHGAGYAQVRRPDPQLAAAIHAALGDARTVLNVGAGAGSYEPEDRHVIPLEPSPAMRAQRPAHLAPAIRGAAESIPLDDRSVDAAMAIFTVHQWSDLAAGLREMRRVARGPVVIVTCDPDRLNDFWLAAYAPEVLAAEGRRYPPIERLREGLGGGVQVHTLPIPRDCTDGFMEAFYARPEQLLRAEVRRAQSAWSFVDEGAQGRFVRTLQHDLDSGAWDERFGAWRTRETFDGALRLIVARP
jgi:SAM-dependent methyltransferase